MPFGITSVSRASADWSCNRKRYWGYEKDGTGYTKNETTLPLLIGSGVHEAASFLAKGTDVEEAVRMVVPGFRDDLEGSGVAEANIFEQAALVEGIIRGLDRYAIPSLEAEYPEVVMVEEPLEVEIDGVVFVGIVDLVRRAPDGRTIIIDYKTTSSNRTQWIDSWVLNPQVHVYADLYRRATGDPVEGMVIQGAYKGYHNYGKQNSIFCYGYERKAAPPFTNSSWTYEYQGGYRKSPVWTAKTVKEWVDNMPIDVLTKQFPQTPVIFPVTQIADDFYSQEVKREEHLNAFRRSEVRVPVTGRNLDVLFRKNLNACQPSFGAPCKYLNMCQLGSQPEDEGFEPRELNDREKEVRDEANGG